MWTREQVKGTAKYVLSFSYWKALLACLIVSLVTSISTMGSSYTTSFTTTYRISGDLFSWQIGGIVLLLFCILSSIGILFGIFVANPVEVGKCRFFLANRQNKGGYDQIFSLFKSGVYLNVVKTMFLRDLYVFLWSLLFVIPGIVKSYEYSMIPYILAENPNIDSKRAFAISRSMTQGEKGSIFVLDLSFLGWLFLGAMACGIGTLFVAPYIQATLTELYEILKYKVISGGMAGMDELGGQNGYIGEERPIYQPYSPAQGNAADHHGFSGQTAAYPGQPYPQTGFSAAPPNPTAPESDGLAEEEKSQSGSWFEQQVQQEKNNGMES